MKLCAISLVSFFSAFLSADYFPSGILLLWLFVAMVVDFATGVSKAYVKKQARTSRGYRQTLTKFMQYAGAIIVSILMTVMAKTNSSDTAKFLANYMGDALVWFILFIEITSILENLIEIDRESTLSRLLFQPLLRVLTFQLKNFALPQADAEAAAEPPAPTHTTPTP